MGEVVISSGGHDEHKADGGRLYDGAEDFVKVDAELLGVAISNQARLEFLDRAVTLSLDIEHVVAVHGVRTIWHGTGEYNIPRAQGHKPSQLFGDRVYPVLGPRAGRCLLVATGNWYLAKISRGHHAYGKHMRCDLASV